MLSQQLVEKLRRSPGPGVRWGRREVCVAAGTPASTADEVVIVVRDSGGWRPESSSESRGRGLRMVRSSMTDVDVVRSGLGTEIVMRRRLD